MRRMGKGRAISVYSPMALAGKMGIYDVPETIRTRSIIIPMQRSLPGQAGEQWDSLVSPAEAEPIRWLLQCWTELVHGYALEYRGPNRPELPKGIRTVTPTCGGRC